MHTLNNETEEDILLNNAIEESEIHCEFYNETQCKESEKIGKTDGCLETKSCGPYTPQKRFNCYALWTKDFTGKVSITLKVSAVCEAVTKGIVNVLFFGFRGVSLTLIYVLIDLNVWRRQNQLKDTCFVVVKGICAINILITRLLRRHLIPSSKVSSCYMGYNGLLRKFIFLLAIIPEEVTYTMFLSLILVCTAIGAGFGAIISFILYGFKKYAQLFIQVSIVFFNVVNSNFIIHRSRNSN